MRLGGGILWSSIALLLAALLLQPIPPTVTIHTHGCPSAFCALVRGADTITSDQPYTEDLPPPESGYQLLIFAHTPSRIEARGPGGTTVWPDTAPTPLPTRPPPTLTPRSHLNVVLDGVSIP